MIKRTILFMGSLLFSAELLGQVSIADANTAMPDYSVYYEGVHAREAGDLVTAVRKFTESAEGGLAIAQYNLGVMYYSGNGVPQDFFKAFEWTRQAAEQGHVAAMVNLGVLYYNQIGVNSGVAAVWPFSLISRNTNFREAARWYGHAAEYDHGGAQYYLATMYQQGTGVEQDLVMAWKWANLARDNDVPDASLLLASISQDLTQSQRQQAQQLYAEWVLSYRN
jgi:TPR repeat protein